MRIFWGYIWGTFLFGISVSPKYPQMKLSAIECKNAKPKEKAYKLSDGGGLFLFVKSDGKKYWRWKYRYAGKEKLYSVGVYPEISLGEARQERDAARRLLREGKDPTYVKQEKKRHNVEKGAHTFERIAREWHEKRSNETWSAGYAKKVLDSLEKDVFPTMGKRPIADISPKEMLDVLSKVTARGVPETASRVKQRCKEVFNYAITKLLRESNPVEPLKNSFRAPKNKHFARLKIEELPEFMERLGNYYGRKQTALAIRFLAYTFVRTGELRYARWTEFDLTAKLWRIPAERMKMKEEHIVPLSEQVIQILDDLKSMNGNSGLVFPGDQVASHPISENTILFALYRMGYKGRMTGHGFRGIASTALNEMGYMPDVIERQLAHSERNSVRAAYNHAQYLPDRVKMMQEWANYLDVIANGEKVFPIKKAA